jgi:hypothetical protein
MFITRRTVLRVFGWTVFLFFVFFLRYNYITDRDEAIIKKNAKAECAKIVNELRALRGAALMFRIDHGRLPLPGEEASLDFYLDKPLVASQRYAKVMFSDGLSDDTAPFRLYVGVKLIPENNGRIEVQKELASAAEKVGILDEASSGGKKTSPYKSGLNVYMEIPSEDKANATSAEVRSTP